MAWAQIIGQDSAIQNLRQAISGDRLPNAYLFIGPEGVGKEHAALEVAKVLNCDDPNAINKSEACDSCESCLKVRDLSHQNIEIIFPVEKILLESPSDNSSGKVRQEEALERLKTLYDEKRRNPYFTMSMDKSMGILKDQVLMLQEKAGFKPLKNKHRVYIISQADRLNDAAANKLLKLLEEPPGYVLFILVSSRPEKLLPTVVSRCQPLKFAKINSEEIQTFLREAHFSLQEPQLQFISSYAQGNMNHVLSMAQQCMEHQEQPELQTLRDEALQFLRVLLSKDRGLEVIRGVEAITKRDRSRQEQHQWLTAMLLIFRDVINYQHGITTQLLNADIEPVIAKFAQNFPNADFQEASKVLEQAQYAITRNANILLVFTNLSFELKASLTQPAGVHS